MAAIDASLDENTYTKQDDLPATSISNSHSVEEKHGENSDLDSQKDLEVVPYGVRRIEIISDQYKNIYGRVLVYFCIFLVAYGYGLDGTTRYTFQTQATASYSSHSLLATINTVRNTFAAAALPFIARLCDMFGRLEIFIVAVVFYVIGTIIESQAYDVKRFAAGALFYQFGYTGSIVTLQLMSADFSFLNWRVAASFVVALPFIINTWVSGTITGRLVDATAVPPIDRWSWGIGMWAFIYPILALPLICCYLHMYYLAKRSGALRAAKDESARQFPPSGYAWYHYRTIGKICWEMDLVGSILLAAALACFLVPFTLAGGLSDKWKEAHIIVPLVIGFLMFPVFIFWEYYIQSREFVWLIKPLMPGHMIKDRGVWSALGIAVFIDWVWYMQGDYLYTVLIVGVGESVKSATRITSLYSFVSVVTGSILGLVIAYFRRLKAFILFGISMWFVSFGLLIHYRGGDYAHAGIIGAQCLLGFGAGFFTYPTQTSIQTCTNHIYMGTAISMYLAAYYVGSAFGTSISGAIWTQLAPKQLLQNLNGNSTLAAAAYGDPFTFAATYPFGTPERDGLVRSYQHVQKILCTVGVCLCVPLIGFAFCLRDRELGSKQSYEMDEIEADKSHSNKFSDIFKFELKRKSASTV
ncbi:major facilitator superfamily domain-containing protein [Lipomyces oligophaga]|uniref:major facilitator superfamily domain-containing protein n=1 Tax=Lipomyces oligophaga TaxID=45792 RepID=UPI0034CE4379